MQPKLSKDLVIQCILFFQIVCIYLHFILGALNKMIVLQVVFEQRFRRFVSKSLVNSINLHFANFH